MIRTIARPSRRRAGLAVALAASFALTACGSGPSTTNAAAVIGDDVIALDDVQDEIQWLLDNAPQAQQAQEQRRVDQVSSEILRSRVVHELLTVAERRERLTVDETEVDSLIDASGGVTEAAKNIAVEPSRVREVARDQLMLEELGARYQDRLSVHFVGAMITESSVEATDSETARELGRSIAADPQRAREIVRDGGHQLVDQRISLSDALTQDPELAISAVFGAEEGTVVVIQPSQQQPGWLVALVEQRSLRSGGGENAEGEPVDPRLLYWVGLRQLQPIADELGVRLNPRYGVWDEAGMAPAPSEEEVTGYQWESRTVAP
ncbi:hypothetical protein FFT09_12685 [Saccharomonospora piscinae]|uniref:SurA N-terminal domain-containing protein n=1 Tax=Saccharomonospora piscinae TaxID=687388 RepID=UPI001106E8DD|nr:SurA N-terminal domain-containing protein [Saccharomonospora piscinae]TLW91775.1 hypothetical protein FFT09_12685 [Saccharomonospora piscinae]